MRKALNFIFSVILAASVVFFFPFANTANAQSRQALQTHATAPVGAQPIGHLPASQRLSLAISLPLRNQEQLNTLLQQLEDPASPSYHHYLSPAQFTEQFGPTVEQYQQVISFAKAHGFTVTRTSPSRRLLNVTGTVTQIEQTFQVAMQIYQHPTEHRTYFAPSIAPTIDAGLPILGVSGLTTYTLPHPMLKRASPNSPQSFQTGSGSGGQFLGSDMRAAYYGSGPLAGQGQAIALAELGPWSVSDVQAYFTSVGQTLAVPIVSELTGGDNGQCIGLPTENSGCDDGEEVIDMEQIISMAPNAPVLIVYTDYTGNADVDIFDAYSTDNIAKQMSFSFGIGDGNAVADEGYFATFHAQGQNFFVASGDAGAFDGTGGWPGFSSNVTDVGGTDLTTNGAGGPWESETSWVGSGGGWCDSSNPNDPCNNFPQYDTIPDYQSQAGVITTANEGSKLYRNVPDVAAEANTDNWFCANGGCFSGIGGTSLAAPRWAGFLALVNQQAAQTGETVGWLNPNFYSIGLGSNYNTAFHDITTGDSNGYPDEAGYDIVTGWGTPNGQGMINALAPTGGTSAYFTLSASPDTLNVMPGGGNQTATISLAAENGFTGTVALTASVLGAPTGITATVNPTSITGGATSTLTVTADSSTNASTFVNGNVEVVVTGTSSGGIGTSPAFVTLGVPDFALSLSPNVIYLNQSATATGTLSVNAQNGFSGSVEISSLAGLPSGVTGSLNPTAITSSTPGTLTLTASSTAATGPTTGFALNGTSGNVAQYTPSTQVVVSAGTGTGGSGVPVSLSSAYNLPAIYTDGITFGTGLDGSGNGYSANLLTPNRILNGVQFNFGPANTASCSTACINDAVSIAGQTITLPANQQGAYTTVQLLATAFNGPILSQPIKVTYSDGTSSTFMQNFSDWCSCSSSKPAPGQQPGESFAVVMPYRDTATGGEDNTPFNLYAYTFVLNSAKTVQSLTLPAKPSSGGIVIFAVTFTSQSLGTQVSLTSQYNTAGLYNNGGTFPATGGMDGGGNNCSLGSGCADAYSAQQLNLTSTSSPTLTSKGIVFNLGPVNTANCTTACIQDMINLSPGVEVDLPANQQTAYTTLTLLGTGVQGSHTGMITVAYTTGSPTVFQQTFSDWCNYQNATGNETVAVGGMSRINSDGTLNTGAQCNLYSYTFALDSTRTVQKVSLANTDSTNYSLVLAMTLSGNTSGGGTGTPGYTLSAGTPTQGTVSPGGSSQSTVTITPANGYTGTVTLSCSIAPVVTPAPTCSFGSTSPVSVTASGGSATLTFTTVGSSAMVVHSGLLYAMMPVPAIALIGACFRPRSVRGRKLLGFCLFCIVLSGLLVIPACGGSGSSSGGGGGGGSTGTPAGTYTVTITATDANSLAPSNTAPAVTITVN